MKNTLETRLGIFFALCFIVAIVILEMVGVAEYFKPGYRIYADFKSIQDLKQGDLVKMAGVEVGRVEKIDLTNELVRVTMKIRNREADIRLNSRASIKFTGLMGQNFVSIDFGDARSWMFTPQDLPGSPMMLNELRDGSNAVSRFVWQQFSADARKKCADTNATWQQREASLVDALNVFIQQGKSVYEPQLFQGVPLSEKTVALKSKNPQGEDVARLNRLLLQDAFPSEVAKYQGPSLKAVDGATLKTVEQPDLSSLMAKMEEAADEVKVLRKDMSTENLTAQFAPIMEFVKSSTNDLYAILGNVRKVTTEVADGKGTVGKLLFDETLYNSALSAVASVQVGANELKSIATDARGIMNDINAGKGNLGLLVRDDALYRETTNAMTNIREITQKVNRGDGTVGKLINDDSFYKNAKVSLQKLDQAAEGLEDQGPLSVLGIAVGKLF
jgi:hypothetical protein